MNTSRITKEFANYVFGRAEKHDVGVFLIDGKVKTMFPSGARFELMCEDLLHRLVGVYTLKGLTVEMIEDDLTAVGCEKGVPLCPP